MTDHRPPSLNNSGRPKFLTVIAVMQLSGYSDHTAHHLMPIYKYEFKEEMPSIWAVAQKPLRTEISVCDDVAVIGTATLTSEEEGAYLITVSEELNNQLENDEAFIFPLWKVLETEPDTGYVTKLDIYGISFHDRTKLPAKIREFSS